MSMADDDRKNEPGSYLNLSPSERWAGRTKDQRTQRILAGVLDELNERGCFDIGSLDSEMQSEVRAGLTSRIGLWID